MLPDDLRLRLTFGFAALVLIAPLHRPAPAAAALAAVLALHLGLRRPLPWRRLLHLEAFLLLLLLSLPLTIPGTPILQIGPLSASQEGLARAGIIAAKVSASVLFLTLLFAATDPAELGTALRTLRLPEPLVRILTGVLRYLGLIRAEMRRLQEAMRLRAFRPGSNRHTWRSYGNLIGMTLLRAIHRADRIEEAMRLRGYSGRFLAQAPPRPARSDWIAGLCLLATAATLLLWDRT